MVGENVDRLVQTAVWCCYSFKFVFSDQNINRTPFFYHAATKANVILFVVKAK